MKTVLPFERFPKGLPWNKKILYCIVDISGIQSFIFNEIDRFTTMEEIRARSQFVEKVTNFVHHELSNRKGYLFGTASSGKLICGFRPSVKETLLKEQLDALQRRVFASTRGKLTFYFALETVWCIKMEQFQQATMQHANSLLSERLEREKFRCLNLLQVDMEKEACKELTPVIHTPSQRPAREDRVVAKLDLDNLGAFFRDITAFDQRDRVSFALNQTIADCLQEDPCIETIFAGGDDIFFLCSFSHYLQVISRFYSRLKTQLAKNPNTCGYAENFFGISAGLCVLRTGLDQNIPFLSYYEESEQALSRAKTKGGKNCLCIHILNEYWQYCTWDDFVFLSNLYARLKESLSERSERELFNIKRLCEQLESIGRAEKKLNKEEEKQLYEIRKRAS